MGDHRLEDLSGWSLAWSDEFDGSAGSPVDPASWRPQVGGHGWGNRERQYYTGSSDHAALDGAGNRAITVRRTDRQLRGIWPACWMLGHNIDQVGWPDCGEIDVMENFGKDRPSSTARAPPAPPASPPPTRPRPALPTTSTSTRFAGSPNGSAGIWTTSATAP